MTSSRDGDLKAIFSDIQNRLAADQKISPHTIGHPTAAGDFREESWRALLAAYLPERYAVTDGFVLDSTGRLSDQIDVILFDRQFSPYWLNQNGTRYIPAESVYAIFEVKPQLNAANLRYAGCKVGSVRELQRTSAAIPWAGGELQPREPMPILGGILTFESAWKSKINDRLAEHLGGLELSRSLDIGCALTAATFESRREDDGTAVVEVSHGDLILMKFLIRLLSRLQSMATVPAIEYERYLID